MNNLPKVTEADVRAIRKRQRKAVQIQSEQGWINTWRELSEYYLPYRGRNLLSNGRGQDNDGRRKGRKILNSHHFQAVRTNWSGLKGGYVSATRPWFVLGLEDEDLAEYAPVREWLHRHRNRMLSILAGSNFYSACNPYFQEFSVFGTTLMFGLKDFDSVVRYRHLTIGEYAIALDAKGDPNAVFRTFTMTIGQMVEEFGLKALRDEDQAAFKNERMDDEVEISHVIQKHSHYDPERKDWRGMPWRSVYFYKSDQHDKPLKVEGFREIPFFCSRFDIASGDVYSTSSGMLALGDVKLAQQQERDKSRLLAQMSKPTLNVPNTMKDRPSLDPGDANYYDPSQGNQGATPTFQVNPQFDKIVFSINELEKRIDSIFSKDLFTAILASERGDQTAYEVAKKFEEKITILGPVTEGMEKSLQRPVVDNAWSFMDQFGLIEPPPRELKEGTNIKVKFISLLSQAQQMVGLDSIGGFLNLASGVLKLNPSSAMKVNFNEIIDQAADSFGIPPKCINSDDDVAKMEQQQAQMAKMQQMVEAAPQLAKATKDVSQAGLDSNNVLVAMSGRNK